MKNAILALSVFTLVFTACKKDKDDAPNITPTIENLTGSYKQEKIATQVGTNPEQPFPEYRDDCAKDDIYILKADKSYQYQDAGTVCDLDGSYPGNWDLINSTTFRMDVTDYTIRRFNGKNLELTEDNGGLTVIYYYIKQ